MALESAKLFDAISGITPIEFAALTAGGLQIAAYFMYYRKVVSGEVDPNPLSWLMFTYGTIFLLILEIDAGAKLATLVLPAACSAGSLMVAAYIWRDSYRLTGLFWPKEWRIKKDDDGKSFAIDIFLTICYLFAGALASVSLWQIFGAGAPLTETEREWAAVAVLLLSNASTFPGFGPMIRKVIEKPETERSGPWAIWTAAYLILIVVTWFDIEVSRIPNSINPFNWGIEYWSWLALMSYPISCAYLHGRMAWLSRPEAQRLRPKPAQASA
jgi:hypothetical protein